MKTERKKKIYHYFQSLVIYLLMYEINNTQEEMDLTWKTGIHLYLSPYWPWTAGTPCCVWQQSFHLGGKEKIVLPSWSQRQFGQLLRSFHSGFFTFKKASVDGFASSSVACDVNKKEKKENMAHCYFSFQFHKRMMTPSGCTSRNTHSSKSSRTNSPSLKSPPWIMKSFTIRWKRHPL